MNKIKLFCLYFMLILSAQAVSATNPISIESFNEIENSVEKTESLAFVKKAIKWIKFKFQKALDSKNIKSLGIASLVFGVLSLIGLFSLSVGTWVWGVAALLAIIGDILAIIVLTKTRKNKNEHRSARRLAVIGLITSLLTGLLPLILFILILVSLR